MKKLLCLFLSGLLVCGMFVGCASEETPSATTLTTAPAASPTVDEAAIHGRHLTDTALDADQRASVSAPIPLSGFEDVTDADGVCTYQMLADVTDTYTVTCATATALVVTTPAGPVSGTTEVNASVNEGDTVTVKVTAAANTKVLVNVRADNHLQRLPYEANFTVDPSTIDLYGDGTVPESTAIHYQKRKGGTYVYLNNPEKLQPEDLGQAIQRDKQLHGEMQVTWEHSNFTGQYVYLGYQLKNEGTTDVYVTVTNIGYQTEGEWLGQMSWSQYYNHHFELPEDYFNDRGDESERYRGQNFLDYTPRIFQPTTYRIPAGEYIYVIGGTTKDAYNGTNVAETADIFFKKGRCSNAAARFFVTGGNVTGTFYCYSSPDQVQAEPKEQGYITERNGAQFGYQYKGVDYCAGLIENNPVFIVNDQTESGSLPVTYETQYDEKARFQKIPYSSYDSEPHTVHSHSWTTNVNPQNNRKAVATDMSSFTYRTEFGKEVTIDTECADGTGATGNFGNWMIDYHDNITLVNQGDRPRTFTINKAANGALMTYVADRDGNVLSTKCTIIPIEESPDHRQWEIYTVEVPAHSCVQLTVSFLLMGNSYGGVNHWITVD